MPVGATIAAVGTVAGAAIGAVGAQSAAKQQASALNNAEQLQLSMFGTAKDTLSPYTNAGAGAIPALQKLLGLSTGGAGGAAAPTVGGVNYDAFLKSNPDIAAWAASGHGDPTAAPGSQTPEQAAAYWIGQHQALGDDSRAAASNLPTFTAADVAAAGGSGNPVEDALQNIPGYQFARDQGIAAVNRSVGSTGQTGAQIKGIARFVTGLADQTYGEQVARLQGLVNTGASSAQSLTGAAVQTGANAGSTAAGVGTALAGGTVGATNAVTGALGQIPSYLLANKVLGGGGGSMYSGGGGVIGGGTMAGAGDFAAG